jgi:hypothetical protein
MSEAHFFDINSLIKIDSQEAWIVDRAKPNIPILKIPKSDLRLMEMGIWKKNGNKMEFNGKTFWLPTNLFNKIKVKAKVNDINFANLAISLQEFLNPELIEKKEFDLRLDNIINLKNKVEDIYIICSRQTKKNWQPIIQNLKEALREEGIIIKNYYYISDSIVDLEKDDTKFKKMRLLIQHLVGYKTDGEKFTDEEITRYNKINYFDVELDTLKIATEINRLLAFLLSNTDAGLKSVLKEDITDFKPELCVNRVNDNEYNRIDSDKVFLETGKIIKMFENFKK